MTPNNDLDATPWAVVITGAASGLGAAFLEYYSTKYQSQSVIAIDAVSFAPSTERNLSQNVRAVAADLTTESGIETVKETLDGKAVGLLLHCAGVRGLVPVVVQEKPGDVAAAETWHVMDSSTLSRTLHVNSIACFTLIQALVPNLLLARAIDRTQPPRCVVLGSRMGSVAANVAGGGYAYRASKAAVNAIVKSFSLDIKDVAFMILHPGRVETSLVQWKEDGAISPAQSVSDCVTVIDALTLRNSGCFVDRFGQRIDW